MISVAHRLDTALGRRFPGRAASPRTMAVTDVPSAPMVTGPKAVG